MINEKEFKCGICREEIDKNELCECMRRHTALHIKLRTEIIDENPYKNMRPFTFTDRLKYYWESIETDIINFLWMPVDFFKWLKNKLLTPSEPKTK